MPLMYPFYLVTNQDGDTYPIISHPINWPLGVIAKVVAVTKVEAPAELKEVSE